MYCNRTRYVPLPTIRGMGEKERTIREVLRDNVFALMGFHYGKENLNRLAREAKIGPGGATRIKEAKTNIGLGVLEKVARHFKVEPWELLLPEFKVGSRKMSDKELEEVRQAREVIAGLSAAQRDLFLQDGLVKDLLTRQPYPVDQMRGQWDASQKRKR